MKNFLKNVFTCLKNNVGTSVMVVIEIIVGTGIEILANQIIDGNYGTGSIIYIVAIGLISILSIILTIYIGGDSKAFALIRKIIKLIGDENALKVLSKEERKYNEVEAQKKADAEILAMIAEEKEAEKARAEKAQIEAYKNTHGLK